MSHSPPVYVKEAQSQTAGSQIDRTSILNNVFAIDDGMPKMTPEIK